MSTSGRLTKVFKQAESICYTCENKFVFMSDCHRGVGNPGDNFLKNRTIYLAALQYYYQRGFTYVELGDGDELWENKKMEEIWDVHGDVFAMLEKFYKDGRLYMLYGNHDIEKAKKNVFWEDFAVKEGMILEERGSKRKIFLVHGHQGDLFNDTLWKVNRFLVRHIWRKLELFGMENPMSASGNGKKKTKVERRLMDWANRNHQLMIAGHTHRIKFPGEGEGCYFNDGSCVRPYSISGIELENGRLRLVEWSVMTRADYSMYVGRKILDEVKLERYDSQ